VAVSNLAGEGTRVITSGDVAVAIWTMQTIGAVTTSTDGMKRTSTAGMKARTTTAGMKARATTAGMMGRATTTGTMVRATIAGTMVIATTAGTTVRTTTAGMTVRTTTEGTTVVRSSTAGTTAARTSTEGTTSEIRMSSLVADGGYLHQGMVTTRMGMVSTQFDTSRMGMGGSAVSAVALSNHQLLRRGIRYQSRTLKATFK